MTMANASVPLFFQVAMAQTKKTRIGDILEVPTKKGLAYVQFSHEHKAPPCMGPIIRFLPGFHRERPKDLHEVANQKELYYTFFHAPLAVKLGQFQVAGNAAVPDFAKAFPLFRNGDINPSTGQYFDNCWLWDGTKSWKINEFSNEQLNLSIQSIWNDVLLKERIEEEWTPARDLELFSARRESIPKQKPLTSTGVNHFIIYKDRSSAAKGRTLAEQEGFSSQILDVGRDENVQLIVMQGLPFKEEYKDHVAARLKDIAKETGGTYDAWATAF